MSAGSTRRHCIWLDYPPYLPVWSRTIGMACAGHFGIGRRHGRHTRSQPVAFDVDGARKRFDADLLTGGASQLPTDAALPAEPLEWFTARAVSRMELIGSRLSSPSKRLDQVRSLISRLSVIAISWSASRPFA